MSIVNKFDPRFNVKIRIYERVGEEKILVGERETHNVLTDFGRTWLLSRLGSSLAAPGTASHTAATIGYIGFGCGGALQTDVRFLRSQLELVSVIGLEEPVPFSLTPPDSTFLKAVDAQVFVPGNDDFPAYNRTVFTLQVLETEISFAASVTEPSLVAVGTSVPVSEAGLYLNTATAVFDLGAGEDPRAANDMVCYNIFDPIPVNGNTLLLVTWELRC